MQSEKLAAEATVNDHLRDLIQLMKRGGRISVTDIPNDPTFLSSHFGGPTVHAMAEKLEAALSTDAEPVAWILQHKKDPKLICLAVPNEPEDYDWHAAFPVYARRPPLYAEPVKTAPAVAVKALIDAANEVIASSSDTYKKRNGHIGSFEDASGEKCWIVPFDAFEGLRSALSAQVQGESEVVDCLLTGKPFVFDPATHFCHADDGGAPECGIKYVPAAQVQDDLGWKPIETAPKDGSEIILFCPKGDGTPGMTFRVTSGSWFIPPVGGSISDPEVDEDVPPAWLSWDGGFSEETMMPTHWMPLPSPPASKHGDAE